MEEKRTKNVFCFGKLGAASKIITFKEKDFKKELAPAHAIIEYLEIKGERFVQMNYSL